MEDPLSPERTTGKLAPKPLLVEAGLKKEMRCAMRLGKKLTIGMHEEAAVETISSSPSSIVQSFSTGQGSSGQLLISSPTRKRMTVGSVRDIGMLTSPDMGPTAFANYGHVCFSTFHPVPIKCSKGRDVFTKFKIFHAKVYKTVKEETRPARYITHRMVRSKDGSSDFCVRFTKLCPAAVEAYVRERTMRRSPKRKAKGAALETRTFFTNSCSEGGCSSAPKVKRESSILKLLNEPS